MPSLLQRYLFKRLAARSLAALACLAIVYLAFDLGDQGRRLALELGWRRVALAAALHLPLIAVQLLPAALLLGGALTLSALRRSGELEAMATAGAGPARIGAAIAAVGLCAALVAIGLTELAVPPCERSADELYRHRRASALTGVGRTHGWFRGPGGWFVRLRSEGARARVLAIRVGDEMTFEQRLEGTATPPATRVVRPSGSSASAPWLARLWAVWERGQVRPESMRSSQLQRHLAAAARAGRPLRVERLVLHGRLAFPWFNLVSALLLCSLATSLRALSISEELALAVCWIAALWLLVAVGWLLGRSGILSPESGAWLPLLLAFAIAAFGAWRAAASPWNRLQGR